MESTNKFVIFRQGQEEFLALVREGKETNTLGWVKNPNQAKQYDSLADVRKEAQRISDNQGYVLDICELHESETQFALKDVEQTIPKPNVDPSLN